MEHKQNKKLNEKINKSKKLRKIKQDLAPLDHHTAPFRN